MLVRVPINKLSFRVVITNNGGSSIFNLRMSNPLTFCLNPGHFIVREINQIKSI